MTIPKFALNVALTFVCAFPLHSSGASVRMSSQSSDSSGQFNVAPVLSDSVNEVSQVLGMWRVGKWKLDDQYDVVANYFCFSDYRYLVVPYVSKCLGEFQVLFSEERVRARHKTNIDRLSASLDSGVAKLSEQNRIREAYDAALAMDSLVRIQREELQRHVDAGWRVDSGGAYRGSVDFDNVRDKGHLLMVNEVGYELQGFKTIVENNIATVERTVTEQIEQERGKVLTMTALAALGLAVGAFMLFWLLRFVRKYLGHAKEKARQLKDAASGKVDKLQAANQRRKVRSVMMDETIREMTRTALSGADNQSKEVLIAELRKAIESGNHELANALETALKKA